MAKVQSISLLTMGSKLPTLAQDRKNLLGGKGAGLFDMVDLDVPVPGFVVIPTTLCVAYMADPEAAKNDIARLAEEAIAFFTDADGRVPLLSVRSGARVSMPGMMDTILNVGMGTNECDNYCVDMATRMRLDCHRRFLHMFGSTALGIPDKAFEEVISEARKKANADTDADLNEKHLESVLQGYFGVYGQSNKEVPATLRGQVIDCIMAVMDSWNSPRAVEYRNQSGIPHDWGTAVVIQRMVFGNMNDDSGSGVLFSRNPTTGENLLTGEFLPNAQGEDVVAGIRTPLPLADMAIKWPEVFEDLNSTVCGLELTFRDMLDIEFTVENKELFFLQVRTGKRSAQAAVRIALDMLDDEEFKLTRDEVTSRIKRDQVRTLTQPVIDPKFKVEPHGTGLPACAGVVTGVACFTPEAAVAHKEAGTPCILIRHETSPDDIAGMFAAIGILTATGGATSHAAVVARGMDKTCVTGCPGLTVKDISAQLNGYSITPTTKITIDGLTGRVWCDQEVPVSDPKNNKELADLTAFVFGDSARFQYFPGNEGQVYELSQFLEKVEAPVKGDQTILVLTDETAFKSDLVLNVTGGFDLGSALKNLLGWLEEHDRKCHLFVPIDFSVKSSNPRIEIMFSENNIRGFLKRPSSRSQVIELFGDEQTLNDLISPARIEDKFTLFYSERHDLLASFQ